MIKMHPLVIGRSVCGIYKITNLVNGSVYVGCSNDIRRRWMEHRSKHKHDSRMTIALAMRKYGNDNFACEVVEACALDQLAEREILWISKLQPRYNRCSGGRGSAGHTASPEVKALLAAKGREQWDRLSPEQKAARVKHNLCGPQSEYRLPMEARRKISESLRGRNIGIKLTEERRQQIRDGIRRSNVVRGQGHWKQVAGVNTRGRVWYYPSLKIAAGNVGVNPATINHVLRGTRKTAGGCRWFYATVDALGPIDRPSVYEEINTKL